MAEAVGILEVFGLATAFVAADAGCKAANVHLEVFDKSRILGVERSPNGQNSGLTNRNRI